MGQAHTLGKEGEMIAYRDFITSVYLQIKVFGTWHTLWSCHK